MIYGLNFNGKPIPEGYARKFRKEIKTLQVGTHKPITLRLQGVCEHAREFGPMVLQADNGHRTIQCEERRVPGGKIYGLYFD